jgi:hypothetical protein
MDPTDKRSWNTGNITCFFLSTQLSGGGVYFPIFFKPFDLLLGKEHGEKRIKRKTRNRKEKINDGTKW